MPSVDHFEVQPVQADALVSILAKDQRLAVLELHDVLAAGVFFGQVDPGAVIENVAVLQDLDVGRALMRRSFFQESPSGAAGMTSTERATKVASAPDPSASGLNGRASEPNGVDLVFFPNSEVGEYCPLVRP